MMRVPPDAMMSMDEPPPPTDSDRPARCIDCYYVLEGLDRSRCPECGRGFDLNDPTSFTYRLPMTRWRLWLPGVATALVAALLTVVLLASTLGPPWGLWAWFALPVATGAIAGYRLPRLSKAVLIFVGATLLFGLLAETAVVGMAGFYCIMILAVIFIAPILAGVVVGYGMRMYLKTFRYPQGEYLPILLIAAVPIGVALIERPKVYPLEQATTTTVIAAPASDCWDTIMFYEEVRHPPPWILRIGLARPVTTSGSSHTVGDEKTCIYNKGRITKRVTAVEENRRLDFIITEQHIGYERDVRLTGGSFIFEPLDAESTRVTLVTEYEPLLRPRFAWRWGERWAIHTLHGHVLEGMRRNVESASGTSGPWATSASYRRRP
jgi:hypothetical protein